MTVYLRLLSSDKIQSIERDDQLCGQIKIMEYPEGMRGHRTNTFS